LKVVVYLLSCGPPNGGFLCWLPQLRHPIHENGREFSMRSYKRAVCTARAVARHASISLFNAPKSSAPLLLGNRYTFLPVDPAQHWAASEVNLS
jgi:hypothetical protein